MYIYIQAKGNVEGFKLATSEVCREVKLLRQPTLLDVYIYIYIFISIYIYIYMFITIYIYIIYCSQTPLPTKTLPYVSHTCDY